MGLKARPGMPRDPRQDPAFERFVAEQSARLLRSAYLLTGEREAAEDVLQMTLLRIAARWRAAQRAPEAYARRVLVNLVRDRRRRATRRVAERALEEAVGEQYHDASGDHVEALTDRSEVFGALARLAADQREVLVLRFYGDLSVAETAAAIGTSEGTVKSRTSRALARMRELLADPVQPAVHQTTVEIDDHD
jgi:RNA polymerase sigma-70 factor (sigma-E family)